MAYTLYPERLTAFTRQCQEPGIRHALIPRVSPWRNGFIERNNRTDKEKLFSKIFFENTDKQWYQLALRELEYNTRRPHQGIGNEAPTPWCAKNTLCSPLFARYVSAPVHWTNGQVERVNRTIKDATVKLYHYQTTAQLKDHLQALLLAYNHAKRLKTLNGLMPHQFVCAEWHKNKSAFSQEPTSFTLGLYN